MFTALLKGINGFIDSPTLKEFEREITQESEVASELFSWLFRK